jgi:hypothetical protein
MALGSIITRLLFGGAQFMVNDLLRTVLDDRPHGCVAACGGVSNGHRKNQELSP